MRGLWRQSKDVEVQNSIPCLSGWKDRPEKLAVRVHQLLFSKSVFLKTKCGAMPLQEFTKQREGQKKGEFDLTCSADPWTIHYFMLWCLAIVFQKDEKCESGVVILIQGSATFRRWKNVQNCSGGQSDRFKLDLHKSITVLAGLVIQGMSFRRQPECNLEF